MLSQNEINGDEAKALLKAGCRYVAEGSNMGCTQEAIDVFEDSRENASSKEDKFIWYAPGKAANAGGVATSGIEMMQNSAREQWSSEVVDQKLKDIMVNIYKQCQETGAEYGGKGACPSLASGANIAVS